MEKHIFDSFDGLVEQPVTRSPNWDSPLANAAEIKIIMGKFPVFPRKNLIAYETLGRKAGSTPRWKLDKKTISVANFESCGVYMT